MKKHISKRRKAGKTFRTKYCTETQNLKIEPKLKTFLMPVEYFIPLKIQTIKKQKRI